LYADDSSLALEVGNINEIENKLNKDFNSLSVTGLLIISRAYILEKI